VGPAVGVPARQRPVDGDVSQHEGYRVRVAFVREPEAVADRAVRAVAADQVAALDRALAMR
jgi:hypothetical protein